MDKVQHERPLSERRLMVYERLFREGSFRPVTWAKAFCRETKGWYRVNGQHTSNLLFSWKDKLPEFFVTVEEYECDTLEDVAKLYATFDSKMQSRSSNDIYNSFASTIPELAAIPSRTINKSVSGMAYYTWGTDQHSKQPAERAELLLDYPEFVLWLNSLTSNIEREERGTSAILYRAPVIAAMFGTWQKTKGDATKFWTAVRDETDPSPGMPTRKLAKFLARTGVNMGSGARHLRKADNREFFVKCLHAWNAWRGDETTNLNYYPDAKLPAIK